MRMSALKKAKWLAQRFYNAVTLVTVLKEKMNVYIYILYIIDKLLKT